MKHPANRPEQPRIFRRVEDGGMNFQEVTSKPWTPKPLTKAAAVFVAGIVAGIGLKTSWDNMDVGCVVDVNDNVHIVERNGDIKSEIANNMFENESTGTCETKSFSFKSLPVVNDKIQENPHHYRWEPTKVALGSPSISK